MPILIALLLSLASSDALPSARDAEVARGVRLVEQGDLQGGLEALDAAVRRLSSAPDSSGDAALAHLYMGLAYAGLDQERAAQASFREALRRRPDLDLDPGRFPPRPRRLLAEARSALPPETPAARAARSTVRLSGADGKPLAAAVVVDAAGRAVTILSRLGSRERVDATLPDGRRSAGRVVGRDVLLDVALVALETAPPALRLGDSDALPDGAAVIVVPADGTTTSAGRVLGRDRAGTFLATDLSLVETAGGSPVLDADGRCVGIALTDEPAVGPDPAGAPPTANGHIRTFVVPASAVRAALPQLVELGRVRRGWLGVSLEAVTEREAGRRLVGALGALVTEVTPGGPAATAGFRPGDQIVALSGGSAFRDGGEIVRTIASLSPGTVVQVMVTRSKTKRIEWLTATIGERPTDR